MERLTNFWGNLTKCVECAENSSCYSHSCDHIAKSIEKLRDYEDLDEQNRLPKLPCAIGDRVYWLCETKILPVEIEYFNIFPKEIRFSIRVCEGKLKNFTKYMYASDIGKRIFLTQQEAEAVREEILSDYSPEYIGNDN